MFFRECTQGSLGVLLVSANENHGPYGHDRDTVFEREVNRIALGYVDMLRKVVCDLSE